MSTASATASEIDALLQAAYKANEPGAAVIAVKAGQPVLRKGYGLANLELGVAMAPDMVFRLASITKQFTAVAILMLVEQGQLALDDPITRFWPNYPTHAHTITVEHLLTHTSGIRSYTDMAEWPPLWRKDFSVQELIDFFKGQPMQFAPGTRWAYNNSGYYLLGAIIEQLSGQSYEQFMQQRIFDRLGMRQSYYDRPTRIIPKRAAGYQNGADGYTNAEYLSMTQPYAAGALASTVDDLAIWDRALADGTLLQPATLARAWTPYRLTDGASTSYGYGWSIGEWQGRQTMEHSGGIHGFATYALRMPAAGVFVALLSNNPGAASNELLALKIAALLIGQSYQEPTPIILGAPALAPYAGVYRSANGAEWTIVCENDHLVVQQADRPPRAILPISTTEFYVQDMSLDHLIFTRGTDAIITAFEWRGRSGIPERAERVDTPPAAPQEHA
jgi:CubicO group peptidase (beta-lactamase class C family)